MDRLDQFFDGALEPQGQHGFGHQLGGARADHVHAEHLVVLAIGDDLDEALGLCRHLRAAKDAEGERADAHVVAALLRLGFGEAHAADLGVAVGATGHVIEVQRLHLEPGDALGNQDALGRRHVRELGMDAAIAERHDVADG